MQKRISLLLILVIIGFSNYGQTPAEGMWRGQIIYEQQAVPFEFEVVKDQQSVSVVIINGQDRQFIENVELEGDSIFIPMGVFDAEIRASFTEKSMQGHWIKHYRDSPELFVASFEKKRFKVPSDQPLTIEPSWQMSFEPPAALAYGGVGLWQQSGNQITGTIMTEVSDFRYFAGIVTEDSIKASSFDGAHAFMILGAKTDQGWAGTFHFDNGYTENWTASADPEAGLTDPWKIVDVPPGTHRPFYDILASGSGPNAIDQSKYFDKVLVIQLFGTWCPNSLDQSKYLVDWYEKRKDKPVEILAVSYEANYSKTYGLKRMSEYKSDLGIPYDLVLGGRLSKGQAALAFPFMDKIKAFPTLIILDKEGYVRYVHSYFNGPATGAYYEAFDQRFNEIIDDLLVE